MKFLFPFLNHHHSLLLFVVSYKSLEGFFKAQHLKTMDEACWNKNENDDLYVRRKCFYSERKCLRVVFSVSRQVAISSRMKLYCSLSVRTGLDSGFPKTTNMANKCLRNNI